MRQKRREWERRRREAETFEQRKARRSANAAAKRSKVLYETEEQRRARLARCAETARKRRARNAELRAAEAAAKRARRADPRVREAEVAARRARRQAGREAKLGLRAPHATPTATSGHYPAVVSHQAPEHRAVCTLAVQASPCRHAASTQTSVEHLGRSIGTQAYLGIKLLVSVETQTCCADG
ncbi:uncharacterized protein LOC144150211 [Haemaphysalis longicornis]